MNNEIKVDLIYNRPKNVRINEQYYPSKKKTKLKKGKVKRVFLTVSAIALIGSSVWCTKEIIKTVNETKKDFNDAKDNLSNNIYSTDYEILKAFTMEVSDDLSHSENVNNPAISNVLNNLNRYISAAEAKEYDATEALANGNIEQADELNQSKLDAIREAVSDLGDANIYFGAGDYDKYDNAKNIDGEIYFLVDDKLVENELTNLTTIDGKQYAQIATNTLSK